MRAKANRAVVLGAGSFLLLMFGFVVLRHEATPSDQSRSDFFRNSVLKGERLNPTTLAKGERIVIDHIKVWDVGGMDGATYVLEGGSDETLIAVERGIVRKKDWGPVLTDYGESHAYPLTARQKLGLDAFLKYLENGFEPDEFYWQYPDTYELTYFRDGHEIGSENCVDQRHFGFTAYREPYGDLEPFYQRLFSPEEWKVVISFPQLVRDLENEARRTAGQLPTENKSG